MSFKDSVESVRRVITGHPAWRSIVPTAAMKYAIELQVLDIEIITLGSIFNILILKFTIFNMLLPFSGSGNIQHSPGYTFLVILYMQTGSETQYSTFQLYSVW